MSKMFLAGAFALASMPLCAAHAQSGSRIDPTRHAVRHQDVATPSAAQRVMQAYAACVVRDRPGWAEAMIALPYQTPEQRNAVRRAQTGYQDCMGYSGLELRFSADILLGAMAEYLIESRYRSAALDGISQLSDEAISGGALAPRNTIEDIALCVVRRNPTGVRALLGTVAGSQDERAAAQGFAADLVPCAAQGQTVTFGISSLRSVLAVTLYRVLSAPPGAIAAATPPPQ